jgi:hypothetical protein
MVGHSSPSEDSCGAGAALLYVASFLQEKQIALFVLTPPFPFHSVVFASQEKEGVRYDVMTLAEQNCNQLFSSPVN